MQEERKRILEMVKSGMLTVDEADKLLSELDQAQKKKKKQKNELIKSCPLMSLKEKKTTHGKHSKQSACSER